MAERLEIHYYNTLQVERSMSLVHSSYRLL